MEQLSFSEKLKVLVDVSSSSGICIASIFLLLFMAFLFLTTTKKNEKSSKKFYLTIYLILILVMLGIYSSSITDMFDYMMNNFFIAVYFPNLAIYLAAIVATNIILWVTIFNFKEDKLLKIINTIIYCMIHYLLILILNIVNSNSLNVFDQTSVYSNRDALALIGLSSTIFIVWIIFLIIYKMIRRRQKSHEKIPVRVRNVIRYRKKLPDSISTTSIPSVIQGNLSKRETSSDVDLINFYQQQNSLLEQQYQSVLREKEEQNNLYQRKQKEQELLHQYESMLTLEDYKIVLDLLKGKDSKITSTSVSTEKQSEPQIIFSEPVENINVTEESLDDEIEQPKLEELLNLYRSI